MNIRNVKPNSVDYGFFLQDTETAWDMPIVIHVKNSDMDFSQYDFYTIADNIVKKYFSIAEIQSRFDDYADDVAYWQD